MSLWVSQWADYKHHSFHSRLWIPVWHFLNDVPWSGRASQTHPFLPKLVFGQRFFSHINKMKPELRVRRPSWWRRSSSLSSALCRMSPVKFEFFEVHHFSSLMAQGGTRISLGTSLPVMMITPPLTWVESGLFCISLWKTYLLFFAEN